MSKIFNTDWRQTAATIYKKPTDSRILGSLEVDITALEIYIAEQRKQGKKLTLTHFFLVAASRAVKEDVPELNTYIKRGKVCTHPSVDVSVSVLMDDGSMSSVKVEHANELSLTTSIQVLRDKIQTLRKGTESKTMKGKKHFGLIPFPIRNWLFAALKNIVIHWGIDIPAIGFTSHNFGSFILSNIGTLGLDVGYPAVMPIANISFVLILGKVNKKPWVVNDEIKIRSVITLSAALDHRVVDASHAGLLFKSLKKYIQQPQLLE